MTDAVPRKVPMQTEGRITNDDAKIKVGPKSAKEMRAKAYTVQLTAGKRYTIRMNAVESPKAGDFFNRLDPYLVVQDAVGKTLAHDDDSGGNLNAKLVLTVPKDGTYRVFAAAFAGTGSFVLSITEPNVLRQGFPAGKPESADLTRCATGWEIEWEITNPDNGAGKKRSSPSSVLAIRSAKYLFTDAAGQRHWFTVLKNLEVGEIMVPYDHLEPVFLDVSEHEFNIVPAKKEYLGPNCVAPGEILDSPDARMKNRVMKEVHDDGLRWMNSSEHARRGEKMLLWAIFDGGNYRYIMEYGFNDDGVITCRLGATAHNFFDRQKDGKDVHLHVACWRWDPELSEETAASPVGGARQNRVLLVRRVPSAPVPNGRFRVDIAPFNPDEKGKACEGFADWKAEEFTTLRVESLVRKNRSKDPRYTAYDLIPLRSGSVRNYPWKYAFANHDFWVTHRRPNHVKYSEVPLYATGAHPLDKAACTIWHNAASLHVPRGEDHGIDGFSSRKGAAITNWAGFMLKPVNLFDSTPLYQTAGSGKNKNLGGR